MANASPHHYSFVPDARTSEYLAINHRYDDRASSPARKLWPFNRSRSSSPNTQAQTGLSLDTSFDTSRSRKLSANSSNNAISPSGSASSFVVKSVIRASGGVSLPTSPAHDQSQRFNSSKTRQQSSSPAPKRMTLEDSDDESGQQLQYRRSKSKPLGAVASLGVPPGGPGGGVGYGTARSSNDGRPESAAALQQSPFYRPASPSGSITAGDFNRGTKERGRSPRKSISAPEGTTDGAEQHRSGSAQSAASSPGRKPVARITAGPQSLAQQQHMGQQAHYQHQQQQQQHAASYGSSPAAAVRNAGMAGPRSYPGGPPSPSGPGYHPSQPPHDQSYRIQPLQHPHAPRDHSAGPHSNDQRGGMAFPMPPSHHAPGHETSRDESPSRPSRFSFGFNRSRKNSEQSLQRPAAPLDGLPSPVDIPFGRSSYSPLRYDNGAETDYSRVNSPFGSVSPARATASPNGSGFLSTLMGKQAAEEREARQQQRRQHDGVPRDPSPGSNLAGKWFKGVFGRSPRADEKDPSNAADYTPFPLISDGSRSADDEQAYAQKLASMRQARHIVDQERRHMMGPTTPSAQRFDPQTDREFRPRQVVDSDNEVDAAMQFEQGRKKSPPGRKPVPAYLPATTPTKQMSRDEPLTPAQRIIEETRSREVARGQIEAQRREAVQQQQRLAGGGEQPRQMVAAHAQFNGPPTPPKGMPNDRSPQQQRFPSGPHQITREPARPAAPLQTTNPNGQRSSILSPGAGPMPSDLPLRDALQEMMSRFYRFERYSVPLIRSLETRLLDIERDAMLANNPQSRSGARASVASNHSTEMDHWVSQMTSLMKHEVGQLKCATRELKESRELVAMVARGASGGGVGLSNSVSSFGSLAAVTASASGHLQKPEKARETNVSSSTFDSAIPRNTHLPASSHGSSSNEIRNEGVGASPTKAIFGFASESSKEHKETTHARDRSVSPNGRPRYTSVLGQPLGQAQQGRLSPVAANEADGGLRKELSVEDRLKALMDGKTEGASRSNSYTFTAPSTEDVAVHASTMEKQETADTSGSSDIAAALAAIDAAYTEQTQQQPDAPSERDEVAMSKSYSHSSSNSGSASEPVEPLTPTVEAPPSHASAPSETITHKPDPSEDSLRGSILPYMRAGDSSATTSPVKPHFGTSLTASPTAAGRISPNKLFAHKFGASSSTASAGGMSGNNSPSSTSAKLGLVEKKRFTLPAPVGNVTTVQARQGGRISRTPSYTFEDSAMVSGPASAAFGGRAGKPVGHRATLQERVAFFDAAK